MEVNKYKNSANALNQCQNALNKSHLAIWCLESKSPTISCITSNIKVRKKISPILRAKVVVRIERSVCSIDSSHGNARNVKLTFS